jgi:hypothetical protein
MLSFLATALITLTLTSAQHRCPAEVTTAATFAATRSGDCLERWESLEKVRGVTLWHARYRVKGQPDVVTEALFESREVQSVALAWLDQKTSDTFVVERVKLFDVGGSKIIEVFGCLQGTGGCDQKFVLWTPGHGCKELEGIRAPFNAALPKGSTTYKSPIADLDRMVVEGNGWMLHDANGSPSIEMTCRLSFDGAKFRLASCMNRTMQR